MYACEGPLGDAAASDAWHRPAYARLDSQLLALHGTRLLICAAGICVTAVVTAPIAALLPTLTASACIDATVHRYTFPPLVYVPLEPSETEKTFPTAAVTSANTPASPETPLVVGTLMYTLAPAVRP